MSRIDRSTDVRAALRSRQRGFLLNPFRFGGGGGGGSISFVAASTTSTSTTGATSVSATTPAGIQDGDGVFACIYVRGTTSPPAGWTQITSIQAPVAFDINQYTQIWQKDVVTSANSSTAYTWGHSVSDRMAVGYFVCRSTSSIVSVFDSGTVAKLDLSSGLSMPSITGTADDQMVLSVASAILGPNSITLPYGTRFATDERLVAFYSSVNNGITKNGSITNWGTASSNSASGISLLVGVG